MELKTTYISCKVEIKTYIKKTLIYRKSNFILREKKLNPRKGGRGRKRN